MFNSFNGVHGVSVPNSDEVLQADWLVWDERSERKEKIEVFELVVGPGLLTIHSP